MGGETAVQSESGPSEGAAGAGGSNLSDVEERAVGSPARVVAVQRALTLAPPLSLRLDAIARLARHAVDAEVGLVNLVGPDAQTAVGRSDRGPSPLDPRLEHAACVHVVTTGAPLIVPDARRDRRFARRPEAAAGRLRFYVGVPVRAEGGELLGTVCAIDSRPRGRVDAGQ